MAQSSRKVRRRPLAVDVAECRVRLHTGRAVVFVDARRPQDWLASSLQVAGAVRWQADRPTCLVPCPKHRYIVVYCA